MAKNFKTPGVYVSENSLFPPSVLQVKTAIPAFIGYTEKAVVHGKDYHADKITNPIPITSLREFEFYFGNGLTPTDITVNLNPDNSVLTVEVHGVNLLYDSIQMFYANGGGACYVVSVGPYNSTALGVKKQDLLDGLESLEQMDRPTLLVIPETVYLSVAESGEVHAAMLAQCNKLQDRFALLDLVNGDTEITPTNNPVTDFRNNVGMNFLKYGAAYYPWVETTLAYKINMDTILEGTYIKNGSDVVDVSTLFNTSIIQGITKMDRDINEMKLLKVDAVYRGIHNAIKKQGVVLPPSGAMAGIYAMVDASRGVWKAPANVSLTAVKGPVVNVTQEEQENLTMDVDAGKSINAIRSFPGKGTMVWGARTLAGNDNEWRYISVRRFFIMVEESLKKATGAFVFEPNDANTWLKVRSMIENFLMLQWRAGALAGAKPEEAFYVRVGLGQTMTAEDILNGYMHVEIGMAVIRPAEFIVLKFSHKLQVS